MCSFKLHYAIKIITILLFALIPIILSQTQVEIQPIKRVRRPNRFDHSMCRQRHNGLGIRASAILNRNGELCKTYCRVINRVNGTAIFLEYNSPNNLRCGPRRARCIDGICQSLNGTAIGNERPARRRNRPRVPNNIIPDNNIGSDSTRRVRTGRRGVVNRQKTTSLSTDVTELSETSTAEFVVKENPESDNTNAKFVFPDN